MVMARDSIALIAAWARDCGEEGDDMALLQLGLLLVSGTEESEWTWSRISVDRGI